MVWHKFLWCQYLAQVWCLSLSWTNKGSNPTTMTLSSFHSLPYRENMLKLSRGWCTVSQGTVWARNVVSPPGTQWFLQGKPTAAPQRQKKKNQSQPVSPAPSSPLSPLFSLFPPLTISPPHHSPPTLLLLSFSFCLPPLFWAIGLLFMASPIEDALLYKTLEPSTRPTPFEDVAHNSYLGL